MGIRSLFLVGGEPFIWQDGNKNLESIVKLAREKGFFKVSICTNGTLPLETSADLLWVSIDGLKEIHNKIRGNTFDRVITNIKKSSHKKIFVNFTINSINSQEVVKLIKLVKRNQKITGIFINFHTPYSGVENLSIPAIEKRQAVDKILKLKRSGYPVLNSEAGLLAFRENNRRRPTWLCKLIDEGRIFECCCREAILDKNTCNDCGIGVAVESSLVGEGNLQAILNSLIYF